MLVYEINESIFTIQIIVIGSINWPNIESGPVIDFLLHLIKVVDFDFFFLFYNRIKYVKQIEMTIYFSGL